MTKIDVELEFVAGRATKAAFAGDIAMTTLITLVLYALFVAAFYFLVAAKVERRVVNNNVDRVLDNMISDLSAALSESDREALKSAIVGVKAPDMKAADNEVKKENSSLTKKTFIVLGSIAAGALVIVMLIWGLMRLHALKKLPSFQARPGIGYPDGVLVIVMALLAFAAVVVTEFIFLYAVGARYWALDDNKVKESVTQTLINFAKE